MLSIRIWSVILFKMLYSISTIAKTISLDCCYVICDWYLNPREILSFQNRQLGSTKKKLASSLGYMQHL